MLPEDSGSPRPRETFGPESVVALLEGTGLEIVSAHESDGAAGAAGAAGEHTRARPVVLEIAAGGGGREGLRVVVEVAHRDDRPEAFRRTATLAVSYWPPEGEDGKGAGHEEREAAAVEACERVAARLAERDEEVRALEFLPPSEVHATGRGWDPIDPPGAGVGPSRPELARALGDEAALLAPSIDAYPSFYRGRRIRVRSIDGGATLSWPTDGTPDGTFLQAPRSFAENLRLRRYVEGLGFAWDAAGRVRTVPTPATFLRRAAGSAPSPLGFHPKLLPIGFRIVPMRLWLESFASGAIPIGVGTRSMYRVARPLASGPLRRLRRLDEEVDMMFHAVGHDMGVHVLTTHLAPPALVRELGRRALEATRPLASVRGPFAPLPILRFYENDLVRHCRDLWTTVRRPEDFGGAFERSFPNLLDRLARRVRDLERGRFGPLYLSAFDWRLPTDAGP